MNFLFNDNVINATSQLIASRFAAPRHPISAIFASPIGRCTGARWLETFKVYENKPSTIIEPKDEGYTPHKSTHAKSGKGGKRETTDDIHRKASVNILTTVHSLNRR